ncbi:hypothetical protein [Amycolatopsis balhimycina]|uniref:hypothetical protein n=1 Tax=Amycolatopsis balhimycina TaxID=208443 RepID=UPI000362DD2B|nr:hypothetical protein [Amycolatopsis balhimycina]
MTDDSDLPRDRPMPDHLRYALWARLEPELAASRDGERRRKPGKPWVAAAAVGVLAVAAAAVFGPAPDAGPSTTAVPVGAGSGSLALGKPATPTPAPGEMKLVRDCVNATLAEGIAVPDRESWRPAASVDTDTPHGFLVIRNDKAAAVCIIDGGKAIGMMGADVNDMTGRRGGYAKLTAERPFDPFTGLSGLHEPEFFFGIVTDDVTAVSLIEPDNSVTPASLRDGTVAVKGSERPFSSGETDHFTFHFRVTLKNGNVLDLPETVRSR